MVVGDVKPDGTDSQSKNAAKKLAKEAAKAAKVTYSIIQYPVHHVPISHFRKLNTKQLPVTKSLPARRPVQTTIPMATTVTAN